MNLNLDEADRDHFEPHQHLKLHCLRTQATAPIAISESEASAEALHEPFINHPAGTSTQRSGDPRVANRQ